ncbi:MAG: hypothetical protein ACRCTI_10365 [Beijerinckiaceae bacterium]
MMLRSTTLAFAALGAMIATAQAGGGCQNCYQKVVTPPVYRTVAEPVVVRPAHTIAHTTPAQYGVVHEKVVVRPAQTVARHVPAEMGTVAETVMIAPARKEWQVTVDAHGRKIGCWVKIPAQYATQHRTVVVRPAQTYHETIPAQYATQARHVMVRPAQVHHQMVPAQYGVQHRTEMVSPGAAHWQPIGRHGHHRHKDH